MIRRIKRVHIFNEDFRKFLSRFTRANSGFIYADPPYDYKASIKMYRHNFIEKDHLDLAEILNSLDNRKVKFLLSYNKTKFIEGLYSNQQIIDIDVPYSMNPDSRVSKTELLIANYPLKQKEKIEKWLK